MGVSLAGNSPLSDIENYPLQRAFWPDVAWEGQLQGQWLTENQPDAVVGYIGFNNDLSESQLAGLAEEGVVPAKTALVAPGTSDLSAQVSEFQAAGVDTVIINIGAPTIGATLSYLEQIDWHPTTFVSSTVSDFHTARQPGGTGCRRRRVRIPVREGPVRPALRRRCLPRRLLRGDGGLGT